MANQPSSFPFTNDVFLSFHGEDTRNSFAGSLSKALNDRGLQTLMGDEELFKGDKIPPALYKGILESRISIIIFSKNYAASSFCLEVLAYIFDLSHQRQPRRFVIPVYYDINPSCVRNQSGSYGEAFANHDYMLKEDKEKGQKWRNALSKVVDLSSDWSFKHGDGYESEFIDKIVDEIYRNFYRFPLQNANCTVGLDSRFREVNALLELESHEVLAVGIYGIGGIGKTTLAEAVYNMIGDRFEASCFLSNVRESSNRHGLVHLQNMLLFKMTGLKDIQLGNANEGVSVIKQRLHQKKVLLVLDDVDRLEQLEALAGGLDWLGSGSRVIITSRNRHLLTFHGVVSIYRLGELNDIDALELFSQYAFKQSIVDPNYIELSKRAVTYASGIPLALKVIGSYLFGRRVEEWQYAFRKLEKIPHVRIQNIVRESFDALDQKEKDIFLDITCCFKGYKLTDVENILHACYGQDMKYHIKVLINKSLINISLDGNVTTHDLIQDTGKEIVRLVSPKYPGRRSRLWLHDDIVRVLKSNTGTSDIEIIHLDSPLIEDEEAIEWDGKAFEKMPNLRILIIRKCHFSQAPKYLPKRLKVLEWWRYPSDKLPSDFDLNQLDRLYLSDMGSELTGLLQILDKVPEVSQTVHEAAQVMMPISHWDSKAETAWRVVGLMSSVVGLICYALSPSFYRLIGKWTAFKFFLYGALCAAIFTTILFANESSVLTGHGQLKTFTNFAVLMIISVYSFFYDRAVNGNPEILSIVSNAAFALVSLSLQKLINLGFEIGVFSYFLGCFTIQLLTINWMLIFVALFVGCPLFVMYSSLNFQQETASGGHVIHPSSHSNPNVDSGGQFIDQSSHSIPNVDSGGQAVDPSSHSNPNVDSGGQNVNPSSHSNPNVDSGGKAVDPSSHSNPNVDSGGQNVDPSSHSNPNVDSGGQAVHPSSHSNPNVDSGCQDIHPSSNSNPNVDSDGQHVIDIPSEC